jgi:hypothetical protein
MRKTTYLGSALSCMRLVSDPRCTPRKATTTSISFFKNTTFQICSAFDARLRTAIERCWKGEYNSVEEIKSDLSEYSKPQAPRPSFYFSKLVTMVRIFIWHAIGAHSISQRKENFKIEYPGEMFQGDPVTVSFILYCIFFCRFLFVCPTEHVLCN